MDKVNYDDVPGTLAFELKQHFDDFSDHCWRGFNSCCKEIHENTEMIDVDFIKWRGFVLYDMQKRHDAEVKENGSKHPAAFPLMLTDRVISSTKSKVILDPFIGSGTTAISSIKYGRTFIGFDISPEYCKMATSRINNCLSQPDLWSDSKMPFEQLNLL